MNIFAVITTINEKTEAIEVLESLSNITTIIVADKKTPRSKSRNNIVNLSISSQKNQDIKYLNICHLTIIPEKILDIYML